MPVPIFVHYGNCLLILSNEIGTNNPAFTSVAILRRSHATK